MKKTALLMLCTSLGGCNSAAALPPASSDYQSNMPAGAAYGAPAPMSAAPDNSAIYELLGRLEQLQSEVQQLRGMVEEQAQTIADLERKQSNMYSDLDERIQLLSSGTQPAQPAATAAAPTAAEAGQAAATATPEQAAGQAQPATPATPPPAQVPATEPAAQQAATSQPAEPKQSDQERYQQAYEALRNGHNAQAIKMFESLYADNPAGEFGDNTQYWLGEAYKINREFDKARSAFNKVVSQYPNSSKVPDALLKLGYIELEQQNPAKARDYFTRITTSYPGTTAAHLAAKKLAQMSQ